MRSRARLAVLLSAFTLLPWREGATSNPLDHFCREASVEIPGDIRKEVHCMRRGGSPPPIFRWNPTRPSPGSPHVPGTSPSAAAANPFDRNEDGKMDCWKDAAGPSSRTAISSPFGSSAWRSGSWHFGVDLISKTGNYGLAQPVRAIADGTIAVASTNPSNGNFVEIIHADGRSSMYLHLKEVLRKEGVVRSGDVIGRMNCTGLCGKGQDKNEVRSTHLHLEIKTAPGTARLRQNRLDPITYLGECT